jgi:hypothetical protein
MVCARKTQNVFISAEWVDLVVSPRGYIPIQIMLLVQWAVALSTRIARQRIIFLTNTIKGVKK